MFQIVDDVLAALDALHEVGLVHRDVKPENVMLERVDGALRGRLGDMGIARPADRTRSSGSVLGTDLYIAPEVHDGAAPSPQSDLWAVGYVLYEGLFGAPPHADASTTYQAIGRLRAEGPDRPPRVPDPIWNVVVTLLAPSPGDRPSSADAARALVVSGRPAALAVSPVAATDNAARRRLTPRRITPRARSSVRFEAAAQRSPTLTRALAATAATALVVGGLAWVGGRDRLFGTTDRTDRGAISSITPLSPESRHVVPTQYQWRLTNGVLTGRLEVSNPSWTATEATAMPELFPGSAATDGALALVGFNGKTERQKDGSVLVRFAVPPLAPRAHHVVSFRLRVARDFNDPRDLAQLVRDREAAIQKYSFALSDAPTLNRLVVAVTSASLIVGEQAQVSVQGFDRHGSAVPAELLRDLQVAVSVGHAVARVEGSALAALAPGNAVIRAVVGDIRAETPVTVAAAPAPPTTARRGSEKAPARSDDGNHRHDIRRGSPRLVAADVGCRVNTFELALMIVGAGGPRPIVATVRSDARVEHLASALGGTLTRLGQRLDPTATLVEAGVRSGETLGLDAVGPVDLRQLGPELRVIGGAGAGGRRRLHGGALTVGRAPDADVVVPSERASRRHVEVRLDGDCFAVRDLESRNGTWINGIAIEVDAWVSVDHGTPVRIGDSVLTVAAAAEAPSPSRDMRPFHVGFLGGRRASAAAVTTRAATATTPLSARRSLVPYVVPTAGAVALAAAAGGAPAPVAFGATPAAVVLGLLADRGLHARSARKASALLRDSLAQDRAEISSAAKGLAVAARILHPDPATLAAAAERQSSALWSVPAAELELRVGLADRAGAIAVEGEAASVQRLAAERVAHLMPEVVGFADGPVVLAGPEPFLDDLTTWFVMQSIGHTSPHELELVVLTDDGEHWAWTAWAQHAARPCVLPAHVRPHELPQRRAPHRLLVLDNVPPWSWADAGHDNSMVVWRSTRADAAPAHGGTRITAGAPFHVDIEDADTRREGVLADVITNTCNPDDFALRIGALRSLRSREEQSDSAVFLDELVPQLRRVDDLVRTWAQSGSELEVVLGLSDGDTARLTLAGQNSHVLVAGTTGSGKTRLLETLACSLAGTHAPKDLHVLVIDFKGGNELAALAGLPHCVGFISDRDPAEVDRAITALTREVARRDAAFASVGATDYDDYRHKRGAPMARLVVIADEFGQFRRDDTHGSRVAALLRIATQGRSKGVHLVLATQSPSTDVTTEIRQNVGVRLCLRVAEPAESVAVLGTPDAALLPRVPGRMLMAIGGDPTTMQVATSRASRLSRPEPVMVRDLLDAATTAVVPSQRVDADVLREIVETIAKAAALTGDAPEPLLSPPLPERLMRADVAGADRPWTVGGLVLGVRDRPGALDAVAFGFDPARDGSLTVVGGPRSGRTSTLLAVAEAVAAQADQRHRLVVHAIDWDRDELSALDGSAYDGGVVRREDFEHLRRVMRWLAAAGEPSVQRVVLIDRLDALLRDLREVDGALASDMTNLLSTGPARGVFPVVTVDVAALLSATSATLAGPRLVLRVDDPMIAAAAGVTPRPRVPGRGLALPDGDDVQIGLANGYGRADAPAGRVARMPDRVHVGDLDAAQSEGIALGTGGATTLATVAVDLDEVGPILTVIGRSRSGRSSVLDVAAATYVGRRDGVRVSPRNDTSWDPSFAPSLVLVDDAARLAARFPWLASGTLGEELRSAGHVLIAVFEQSDLNSLGFGHWLMRRPGPGVLLALDPTPDRIVAGERLGFHPPAELRAGPPGRGWWCERGRAVSLQVALRN